MNKTIVAVIGLLVIAGGVYAFSNSQKEVISTESDMMQGKEDMTEKDSETSEPKEGVDMMDSHETSMDKTDSMMKVGSYEEYGADKIARAETGDVVLFFHASWCPSCRGLSSDVEANVGAIPAGVSILKVNYDKETALKKKYGVTTQHTLVQVDKEGNLIKKWSGGPKLANLVSEIQ